MGALPRSCMDTLASRVTVLRSKALEISQSSLSSFVLLAIEPLITTWPLVGTAHATVGFFRSKAAHPTLSAATMVDTLSGNTCLMSNARIDQVGCFSTSL